MPIYQGKEKLNLFFLYVIVVERAALRRESILLRQVTVGNT